MTDRSESVDAETKAIKGWYPGKYLEKSSSYFRNKGKEDGADVKDEDINRESERKDSSMLSSLASWLPSSGNSAGADGEDDDETPSRQEEERKNENVILFMIKKIRNKLIARKLVGQILIHRLSGIVVTKIHCTVRADDIATPEDDDPMSELNNKQKRAITTTDAILNSLERRSRAWDGVDFNDDVTLTRGATIGVSDPFVGMIGFSFTYEITCTVKSLLASRRRLEAARESISSTQPPRSMSFSFSMSSGKSSTNANGSNREADNEGRGSIFGYRR
jgi:hypothetical protein